MVRVRVRGGPLVLAFHLVLGNVSYLRIHVGLLGATVRYDRCIFSSTLLKVFDAKESGLIYRFTNEGFRMWFIIGAQFSVS